MSDITFTTQGAGAQTIICFPGWIHPVAKERRFVELLSAHYTVISVDLPGYNQTPDAPNLRLFPEIAQQVNDYLTNAQLVPDIFFGFSMGCHLILELYKKYPRYATARTVFVGCPLGLHHIPFWAKTLLSQPWLITTIRAIQTAKTVLVATALKEISDGTITRFSSKTVTSTGAFDSLIGLLNSRTHTQEHPPQTLHIYGEHDFYLKTAKKMQLPNMHTIPGAGHNCIRGFEEEVLRIVGE